MIKSFADRDTQALYEGKRVRRFDGLRKQAEKRLQILRRSRSVGDLQGLPSTPLEASSGGDRVGHSVSGSIVNGGSASDGTTPEFWMDLQSNYELRCARRELGDTILRDVTPRVAA